jgi:hypothetical protein
MDEPDLKWWKNCYYFAGGDCPERLVLERVYLMPHLLDPMEIETIKQACENCTKRNQRYHTRVSRPLRVALIKDHGTPVEGDIVDVSQGGAYIKLKKWIAFARDEKLTLKIYHSEVNSEQSHSKITKVSALVKRTEPEKEKLAVSFLEEIT